MEKMPDECIDLTVTSPPYDRQREYKGFIFDFEPIAWQLYRVIKKGGVLVWIVNDTTTKGCESLTSFKQAIFFVDQCGFRLHDTMIYAKRNYIPLTHNRYEQAFEYMFILGKGKPKTFNPVILPTKYPGKTRLAECIMMRTNAASREKQRSMRAGNFRKANEDIITKTEKIKSNIWFYNVGGGNSTLDKEAYDHPAIFPEKLALDHIQSWSDEGDLVFDPMCGSGTTLKMALHAKRHFLGFDISQEYVNIAKSRILRVQTRLF